jgi:hypothetical protein
MNIPSKPGFRGTKPIINPTSPVPLHRSPGWFVPVWVATGAILTIVGALSRTDVSCGWVALLRADPWPEKLPTVWGRTVPLALGLVSLATLGIRGGRKSGALVTVPVALSLCSYVVISLYSAGRGAILALLGILIGASLVASGSHATRIFPERRLPRALAGLGGVILFVPFILKDADMFGARILENLVQESVRGDTWGVSLVAWLILALGGLGLCLPSVRPPSKGWTRAISLLSYLLLLAFPFALYQSWWDRNSGYAVLVVQKGDPLYQAWMANWEYRDLMAKFWLLGSGHTILLSSGIAAWVEDVLGSSSMPEDKRFNPGAKEAVSPKRLTDGPAKDISG